MTVCRRLQLIRDGPSLPPVRDIPRRPHKAIGNAPRLAILIEVDDPDDVIIAVPRFQQIGNAFAGRSFPAGPADDDANEWRIQLKHIGPQSKFVPKGKYPNWMRGQA